MYFDESSFRKTENFFFFFMCNSKFVNEECCRQCNRYFCVFSTFLCRFESLNFSRIAAHTSSIDNSTISLYYYIYVDVNSDPNSWHLRLKQTRSATKIILQLNTLRSCRQLIRITSFLVQIPKDSHVRSEGT